MARPGLTRHRKFARLSRLLAPHCGPVSCEAAALGHLELLWAVAYENGDDLMGDAGDVEQLARWRGEPGVLATALVEAGFIDRVGEEHRIHDLWTHAPSYVQKRAEREAERRAKGETISSVRAQAGRKGGLARAARARANGKQPYGNCQANGPTPSTQHPAPAPVEAAGAREREPLPDDRPPEEPAPRPRPDPTRATAQQRQHLAREERLAARFPLATSLRHTLAETWPDIRRASAETDTAALEARCHQRGTAPLARDLLAFAEERDLEPTSLAYFARCLADIPETPEPRPPGPIPVPDAPAVALDEDEPRGSGIPVPDRPAIEWEV